MLGKSTSNMSLEELQKAVMGGNPAVEPYQALAAIEKMVKAEKAKTAQLAQQQPPQGMVAQRKLAEAAALRNPYMAAGLGAAPVASPVTTPMGEQAAPVGMAGGGMVAFAKGGTPRYTYDFPEQTEEERLAAYNRAIENFGANNAELLAPLEAQQAKYAQEAERTKKGGLGDALLAAGLGMMSGKSQHAMQNIGEGGLKGLATYQESQKAAQMAQDKMLQSQADMAKSRIALEKGDQATAVQYANQGRQDKKDAATLELQSQYYAGSNAAQMAAAQARAAAAEGGGWKEDVARQKLQLEREKLMAKDMTYRLARTALATAKNDKDRATAQANIDAIERQHGIGTMPTAAPNMPTVGGDLPSLDSFYKK